MKTILDTLLKESNKYSVKKFIHEFMNDHNGEPRWLRGIFVDEQEKIRTILEYMTDLESQIEAAYKAGLADAVNRIEAMKEPVPTGDAYDDVMSAQPILERNQLLEDIKKKLI